MLTVPKRLQYSKGWDTKFLVHYERDVKNLNLENFKLELRGGMKKLNLKEME